MKIGKSIKIILIATKLERKQLIARLGICKPYFSQLENDKCSGGDKMLKRISNIFNVPAIYMIAASDRNFRKEFPGTYRRIKSRMEALATESVMRHEKNPAA